MFIISFEGCFYVPSWRLACESPTLLELHRAGLGVSTEGALLK